MRCAVSGFGRGCPLPQLIFVLRTVRRRGWLTRDRRRTQRHRFRAHAFMLRDPGDFETFVRTRYKDTRNKPIQNIVLSLAFSSLAMSDSSGAPNSVLEYPATTSLPQNVMQQLPLIDILLRLSALHHLNQRLLIYQVDPLLRQTRPV